MDRCHSRAAHLPRNTPRIGQHVRNSRLHHLVQRKRVSTKSSLRIQSSLLALRRLGRFSGETSQAARSEKKNGCIHRLHKKVSGPKIIFAYEERRSNGFSRRNFVSFRRHFGFREFLSPGNLYLSCASLNHVNENAVKLLLHSPSLSNAMLTTNITARQ